MRTSVFLSSCIILAVLAAPGWSQDIVREDGAGGAFTTIQAAIDGGTNAVISVEQTNSGTIDSGTISVTRNVTIQNDTGDNVVITNSGGHAIQVTTDVTAVIDGFEIANSDGVGVRVSAQHADVTISDCYIHDNDHEPWEDDIANWGNIKSAEVICEGAGDSLIPGESESAAITTTVTLLRCTVEGGSGRLGSAIVGWFGTLNIVDCPLITAQPGAGTGSFDMNRCVVGMGAGHLNLENSTVSLRGATDTVLVNHIGFLSFVADGGSWNPPQFDTMSIDRCILEVNTDQQVTVSNGVRFVHFGVGDLAYRAQGSVTNTVLNFNGLADSDSNGYWIQEAAVDFNYCTILGANNGSDQGGRRGITCNTGANQEVRIANSMLGNWGSAAAGNDSSVGNSITARYCHLWNNGANFGDIGSGSLSNITFDDPPFLNDIYEITVENPKFTDAGIGSMIANPATVTDDVDEVGVRPRGAANDKGAQEGMAPVATPTPTSPPSTSVQTWEIYR